jgi:oligopeptide/dipeptide ABC transporter ATP-binding protein
MEAQIIHLLRELRREYNGIIIVVSHHLGVIAELCDRVYVMYAGEVVERGSTRDIFHNARHPYTRKLLACDPARLSQREPRLPTIPGTLPDLRRRPQGCVFQARCEFADEICSTMPPDAVLSQRHTARCWHVDKTAGAIA